MNRIKFVLSVSFLFLAIPLFAGCSEEEKGTPSPKASGAAKSEGSAAAYNHDMSKYKGLAEDAMKLAKDDDLAKAFPKTKELEKAYDDGTEDFKKAEPKLWTEIDTQMDAAIDATNPSKGGTKEKSTAELQKFIDMLDKVPAK